MKSAQVLLALVLVGCAASRPPPKPMSLVAPYDAREGDVLWAVAPPRNESGTSLVDPLVVADHLVAAIQQVEGLRALPVNRTLEAMAALELPAVERPADGAALARALGADGLVLGSVTAYDPYDPPTLGLSLALHTREATEGSGLDTHRLSYQPTAYTYFPRSSHGSAPRASVALHLDGEDGGVIEALRRYAHGRHDPSSALGWRRYLASMDLYTQFAAHHALETLLAEEATRLAGVEQEP